jgi:hypothetical protein
VQHGVRRKGLIQATLAAAIFVALLAFARWLNSVGFDHTPWEFAIPGGFAIAGLIQAVTGIPFKEFSSRWDALEPWQRGLFGTALVVGIAAILYGGSIIYILYSGAR